MNQERHAATATLDLNLRHLRYFVVLAEELHFGRAAARLGISQPPLSEQIVALETALGTRLFQRTRREVVLTASGRTLYARGDASCSQHAERVREVMAGARSGYAGQLYLGCVPSSLLRRPPAILGADRGKLARSRDPGHRRRTRARSIAALRDGRLDAGLVWEDEPDPPLCHPPARARPLHRRAAPLASARCASKRVALADFAGEPLIVPPRDVTPRQFDRIMAGFPRRRA